MVRSFAFRDARPRNSISIRARVLSAVLCCLAAGLIAMSPGRANADETGPQKPPPAQSATQPTTEPGVRTFEDVRTDIDLQGKELAGLLPGIDSLFDEQKRAEVAPKALPAMKKMADLLDEAIRMAPQAIQIRRARLEVAAMMSLLGDNDGTLQLRKQAFSTDQDEAASATAWEYLVTFAHARKVAEAEKKAVSDLTALARGNTENDMIAQAALLMTQQAVNPEVSAQAEKIITDVLQGRMAQRMAADLALEHKLHALVNKPLVIDSSKVDGTPFSTATWKGKVVLVDFWASWCDPCMREFPHVKKIYDTYHNKGLEVVGISCDTDGDYLKNFLAANPGLSWPELFDPNAAAHSKFHPLAEQFGVHVLPTLFLIDKKGLVRTVSAQDNMDILIPKMLEEKGE